MNPSPAFRRIRIALAREEDRPAIYRLRHAVFARELAQHPENTAGMLTDHLDASNLYITASQGGELLGFISITPPDRDGGSGKYSIDRYFPREEIPFPADGRLYEVRLLAVAQPHRGQQTAGLLMYAAYRWVESRGGERLAAMGRLEILEMYRKAGLEPHGLRARSGACTFELLSATIPRLRGHLARYRPALDRLESEVDWQLDIPFREKSSGPPACYHGGAFFSAVGDEFDRLERAQEIINADVLDAWFPPSPQVIAALREHLPWLLRTSPPAGCEGMARAIARARGVSPESILPGAGSSDLIFLALRSWLEERSRVLILDPMYGEYAFLLEQVIGCRVDRLPLLKEEGYRLELLRLEARFGGAYDLIILVNPNSPTGVHAPREVLEPALARAPQDTRIWIDETYVDYAGPDQSLERLASRSGNILVCKSMSKAYALSGARAAYLCGPPRWIEELKPLNPPWAVSLPGQVAAVRALQDPSYYEERWRETRVLRERLARELSEKTDLEVLPGAANFLLCHLPPEGPAAAEVIALCRRRGLFLRDAGSMGTRLGRHTLRIAVKDAETNRKLVEILAEAMADLPKNQSARL